MAVLRRRDTKRGETRAEETLCKITIASPNGEDLAECKKRIDGITAEVEVGRVYEGPIIRIMDFGAVIQLLPGRDGLLHISQIANLGTTATCGNTLGASPCNTQNYLAAVNAANSGAGLCGHTDWRLPTPRELLTIVHAGVGNPAIDSTYFPNTIGNEHWTAPTTAFAPSNAWAVEFYQGTSVGRSKSTNSLYIRLVRGG